jgi:hypothetical protein
LDSNKLQQLLSQKEGPNLEFKREFYKIYEGQNEARKRQKHELIKDILSLANGNESVAGETAYLIVGADNRVNEFGSRDLYDTSGSKLPTATSLLGMVNAVSDPPLNELQCHTIELDGKQLYVIEIPPSPHLHEITDRLETPSRIYSKYVTLIRYNESVELASAKQRAAILKLKQVRLAEMENPPSLVGAMIGSTLGYIAGGISPFPLTDNQDFNQDISPYLGGVVGGVYGQTLGIFYQLKYKLKKKYPNHKGFIEGAWLGTSLIVGYISLYLAKIMFKRFGSRVKDVGLRIKRGRTNI